MDESAETRTLNDYLRVLKARRRLIIGTTLVAAAVALVFSLARPPQYEATSIVSFTPQFFPQGGAAPVPGQTATPAVSTGVELVTRSDVVDQVSKELKGEFTPDELRSDVTATIQPTSNLVNIKATAESADDAAKIANAFAAQTKAIGRNETRAYYQKQAATTGSAPARALAKTADPVEIVRGADSPAPPTSPNPLRDTLIAACLGFLLGVGVAFLRQALDRRISDPHEIQRELGLPLLGYVHAETLGMAGMAGNGAYTSEDDLEAFRILRANVEFLGGDEEIRTVMVTSPLPEEGKSTVSAGFAYANALAGRRTLLVECDFRRPVFAERFGFDPSPGLSDHLLGEAKPAEVLRSIDVEGPAAEPLPVIPAGLDILQPAELLASPRFERFLTQIVKAYEVVVIDCAPLLPVGDALELLPQVDGVLLCIRIGQTTREQAIAAREAMGHLPNRPTGLVITGLERGGEDDYYGYYSYAPAAGGVGSGS